MHKSGIRFTGSIIVLQLVGILFFTTALPARPTASQFISRVGEQAIVQLPASDARAGFRKLIAAHFDVNGIAQRVFADVWAEASPGQRTEAVALYARWVEDGLMNLLGPHARRAGGVQFKVLRESVSGNTTIVYSRIQSGQEQVAVQWSVRPVGAGWLITNLQTPDGGDLIQNHREEFRMIREMAPASAGDVGIEYIIEELRIRTAPLPAN